MSDSQGRPPTNPIRRTGRPSSSSGSGSGNGAGNSSNTTSMIGRNATGSRPIQRPTQSFMSSSSATTPRPNRPTGSKLVFRPRQPSRPIKEDPDGPASRSASPAVGSNGTPPASSQDTTSSSQPRMGPRRYNNGPRPNRPPTGPPVMIASGPFAQGSGAASRNDHSRSGKIVGGVSNARQGALANLSMDHMMEDSKEGLLSSARLNYREPDKNAKKEKEDYSDPEEGGIEIIDLEDVDQLDELAPRSLPRMKKDIKGRKKRSESEQARSQTPHSGSGSAGIELDSKVNSSRENSTPLLSGTGGKDADSREADALDLSESEEEEIMDDLLDDFVTKQDGFEDDGIQQNEDRLYLFQFPPLFPIFEGPPKPSNKSKEGEEKGENESGPSKSAIKPRRSVAFADDTLGGGGVAGVSPRDSPALTSGQPKTATKVKNESEEEKKVEISLEEENFAKEGQIGRLDVFRDGRVQFNFGNGLIMDVTGGSQSSFLQQIMIIDPLSQKATTIGELDRKFVVSPEITSMLQDAEIAEREANAIDDPEGMEKIM